MVTAQDLVKRSSKAVCATFEREVVVSKAIKAEAMRKISDAGFQIIGSGPAGFGKVKIWFIRRGANL